MQTWFSLAIDMTSDLALHAEGAKFMLTPTLRVMNAECMPPCHPKPT